ncbi:MAG: hypothetical protein AAB403_15685, partial [Planctomycetota bacterium]
MLGTMGMVAAQALGTLSWDLPSRVTYTPGAVLPFTLVVGNPTSGARGYGLQAQVLIDGQVVWYADLLVDEGQWFQVPAGGRVTIQGQFQADRSDFTFRVLLIDQASNQVVTQVQSELASPTAPTPPTTPTTPGFDIAPLFGLMALGLVSGLMGSMGTMFKE